MNRETRKWRQTEQNMTATMSVIPSKHIYEALAQDINAGLALSDLIDNAIDNQKIEERGGGLEIAISVSEELVELRDNSGGIALDALPLMLMPGGTRGSGRGIKGIWGVGAKRAMFSLGREVRIETRKAGQPGLVVKVDDAWFHADDGDNKWQIDYEEDNSLPEGITKIQMRDLKIPADPLSVRILGKKLAKTYRDEIASGTVNMTYNGSRVKIVPEVPWAASPYAPPSRYVFDIPVPGDGRVLHMEMTAGVMTRPGEDYQYGIDFIGNSRVILQNNLDDRMGFEKNKLGVPHPTINRFKAIVRVSGDSSDIPWNSAKSDVNTNHPMYVPIVDQIYQVARQYTSFLRKNYDLTARLFSVAADETEIEEIRLEYGAEFRKVVKPFVEEKKEKRISFSVPEEEFKRLVGYFGLQAMRQGDVGLFLFHRTLEEIVGAADD